MVSSGETEKRGNYLQRTTCIAVYLKDADGEGKQREETGGDSPRGGGVDGELEREKETGEEIPADPQTETDDWVRRE